MGTKETEMKKFKLSDSSIVQIVRLIQMGMLTGTDVTDQLRTFEVCENSSGKLDPSPEFLETFETNLDKMQKAAVTNETVKVETTK